MLGKGSRGKRLEERIERKEKRGKRKEMIAVYFRFAPSLMGAEN